MPIQSDRSGATDRPQLVERDGDTVMIVCGPITFVGNLYRSGDVLSFEGVHVGGASPNALGKQRLREMARHFLEDQRATLLVIKGAMRTTGCNPTRRPKPMTFDRMIR